ncbi:MAG: TetR/AcrR family transcriptional regulator [Myxococcota bacterium]
MVAVAANPRRTQEERSRATRLKIQEGAMRCLKRSGYSGATMVRIAKEAGVTTGALQHHFADRRDLMLSVVREGYERLVADVAEQMPRMAQPGSSGERVQPGSVRGRVDGAIDAMIAGYSAAPAIAAYEVVLAMRDDEDFSRQHLGITAPYAAELDRQWLELFADVPVREASKRTARRVARSCILGLLSSASTGLATVDQDTVRGLQQSVLHLLSPN